MRLEPRLRKRHFRQNVALRKLVKLRPEFRTLNVEFFAKFFNRPIDVLPALSKGVEFDLALAQSLEFIRNLTQGVYRQLCSRDEVVEASSPAIEATAIAHKGRIAWRQWKIERL